MQNAETLRREGLTAEANTLERVHEIARHGTESERLALLDALMLSGWDAREGTLEVNATDVRVNLRQA